MWIAVRNPEVVFRQTTTGNSPAVAPCKAAAPLRIPDSAREQAPTPSNVQAMVLKSQADSA